MSESTRYHARQWAQDKTLSEIQAEIARLKDTSEWRGVEFDDARVNHKRQTRIDELSVIAAEKTATHPAQLGET